jgi:hypothetical protein
MPIKRVLLATRKELRSSRKEKGMSGLLRVLGVLPFELLNKKN